MRYKRAPTRFSFFEFCGGPLFFKVLAGVHVFASEMRRANELVAVDSPCVFSPAGSLLLVQTHPYLLSEDRGE